MTEYKADDLVRCKWKISDNCFAKAIDSGPNIKEDSFVIASINSDIVLIYTGYEEYIQNCGIKITEIACGNLNINRRFKDFVYFRSSNVDIISKLEERPKLIGEIVNIKSELNSDNLVKMYKTNSNLTSKNQIIGRYYSIYNNSYYYAFLVDDNYTGDSNKVESVDIIDYGMLEIYLGKKCAYIDQSGFTADNTNLQKTEGMNCANKYCKVHCPYVSEPNCSNGIFLCYSCRTNPITYTLLVSSNTKE